jgi:hypothetical protein
MIASKTIAAIDAALEEAQEREHRKHLGASVIAKECRREIWYGVRWAEKELFEGQMLRLFDRGQKEEIRFTSWLQMGGNTVLALDPATGEQFRISDCGGHLGGSLDSLIWNNPDVPLDWGWGLGEFKTHNDDSWNKLRKEGLAKSKPQHFGQMQTYQFKRGLRCGLYLAVNKNDDHLHGEIVQTQPHFAAHLIKKGHDIIFSDSPPPRINQSPGFYICRFCVFSDICHKGKAPERNCRTCEFSRPIPEGGKWVCTRYNAELSEETQRSGDRCPSYQLKSNFV